MKPWMKRSLQGGLAAFLGALTFSGALTGEKIDWLQTLLVGLAGAIVAGLFMGDKQPPTLPPKR
jgi:hypothetical protein